MKRIFISVVTVLVIFTLSQPVLGEDMDDEHRIVVNIPWRSITLFQGENKVKTYPVAVGKPGTPTPIGNFCIYNRATHPVWHPDSKDPVLPGPDNPLGVRWMGFYRAYGIHGNNDPGSIGKSISGGCIRMYNYDVEELYSMVDTGVPVQVKYEDLIVIKDDKAVIACCDIYGRVENYMHLITEELGRAGIIDKIPAQKLENLFAALKNRSVVFSDKWVLKVNGEFLTADTIYDRTMIFVNVERLNELFGVKIEWNDINQTGRFMGKPVSAYKRGEKIYASIADVVGIIGGDMTAAWDIQELNYHVNFVKLDGKFLTSSVAHFKTHPEIDISVIDPDRKGFVSIDRLIEEGFEHMIFSKKGYIELLSVKPEGF